MQELIIFRCRKCQAKSCKKCENFFTMKPPKYFNPLYIEKRNEFIPTALSHANTNGSRGDKDKWNFAYHQKMNELWKQQGSNSAGTKKHGL